MYEYRNPYILDFRNIQYYGEMHQIIKEAFDFPDYYGENWDAFWDCIKALVGRPTHIKIIGLTTLEKKFPGEGKMLLDTLEELRHWNDDRYLHAITVEVVESKEQ